MEACASAEDATPKRRKPYTITKQREKWTGQEHDRFLKALKLHGRAWQQIKEYIGTKTAVQIRSHAQKFFYKLEKEALAKGTTVGQIHDFDIPPPRSKRKPALQFPRDCAMESQTTFAEDSDGSSASPSPKPLMFRKHVNPNGDAFHKSPAFTEPFLQSKHAPRSSGCPKGRRSLNGVNVLAETGLSKSSGDNPMDKQHGVQDQNILNGDLQASDILVQKVPAIEANPKNITNATPIAFVQIQDSKHYPAPPEAHPLPNPLHVHHSDPSFVPFAQVGTGQEALNPLLPSACSNLIAASLLQNPALHAMAILAASAAHSPPLTAPELNNGGMPGMRMNSSPNMAAVAAATVAAAAAWWASNGLAPPLPIMQPIVGFPAVNGVSYRTADLTQSTETADETQFDGVSPKRKLKATDFVEPNRQEKSSSGEIRRLEIISHGVSEYLAADEHEPMQTDSDEAIPIRASVHSSYGSSSPFASDMETEIMTEQLEEALHKPNQPFFSEKNHLGRRDYKFSSSVAATTETASPPSIRGRNSATLLSGKSVVPYWLKEKGIRTFTVDLNQTEKKADEAVFMDHEDDYMISGNEQVKLKPSQSAFKPYKRCSIGTECSGTREGESSGKTLRIKG